MPDVLLLQETWLLESESNDLLAFNDYNYVSVSGINQGTRVITGRKHGGIACLWKKSLPHEVTQYDCKNNRMCSIIITLSNGKSLQLVNAYLPCDNYNNNDVNTQFATCINDIEQIYLTVKPDMFILGGDLNVDFLRGNAHSKYLNQMLTRLKLNIGWSNSSAICDNTFNGPTGSSCIDHYVMTDNIYKNVMKMYALDHDLNPPGSWHLPIVLHLNSNFTRLTDNVVSTEHIDNSSGIAWNKTTPEHYTNYRIRLDTLLENCQLDNDVKMCKDLLCSNEDHALAINKYSNDIVNCCISAGEQTFPVVKHRTRSKPYWNEIVAPKRNTVLFWGRIWRDCGRPTNGTVANIYKQTKREYHSAVKYITVNENELRNQRMLETLLGDNARSFWTENKKMNKRSKDIPNTIDQATTPHDIAETFAKKYKDIYNANASDDILQFNDMLHDDIYKQLDTRDHIISAKEVEQAGTYLKPNKPDGAYSLWSNHLIHGSPALYEHISTLLTSLYIHGISTSDLLEATIISIPKDAKGSMTKSSNYRGIALISALSKLNDIILKERYGKKYLYTSNFQFAYKEHHSTIMCYNVVKETANYYLRNNSNVYCCMLDASKAFDYVHYDKLFTILRQRGLPFIIICFLLNDYVIQLVRTKFATCYSSSFSVSNGVKQGRILSPILYCIYQL